MKNLEERLRRGPLSELELLSVARSVATELSVLHRDGRVHRDLMPENILLRSGTVEVIGLGSLTKEALIAGAKSLAERAFLYCAPEQSGMVRREADGRADLYALGA